MPATFQGRFITLEGGDGSGKSTQARLLKLALENSAIQALATREPGGTPAAEEIRRLVVNGPVKRWNPISEILLFTAARNEHIANVIEPALAQGLWVICDRFADSTMAYQGYGQRLGTELCERVNNIAHRNFTPDLTLMLDLPVEAAIKRAKIRQHDESRYEHMDLAFHQRVRNGYLAIADRERARCRIFDATLGVQAVHNQICRAVAEQFGVAFLPISSDPNT